MERQRSRALFPSPTRALSTDPTRLYCRHVSHLTPMSVGYLRLGASLFPRVSLFLLLRLLLPSVPRHYRTDTLRPRTVDPRCRRYPLRLPLTASWVSTRFPFPQFHPICPLPKSRLLPPCIGALLRPSPLRRANHSICHLFPAPAHALRPSNLSRARLPPPPELVLLPSSRQSRSRG